MGSPLLDSNRLDPGDPVSASLREGVQSAITDFLAGQREPLAAIGPELSELSELAAVFTGGGKRLRPAFCLWGYAAAAGLPSAEQLPPLLRAAASLDLLHVSALVHDDVMDASDTRRGLPAVHRQLEARHRDAGWQGPSDRFGQAGAILLGDLLVMWSVQLLESAGLEPAALTRALPLAQAMRTEVTCGQYLDVLMQHQPSDDPQRMLDQAQRVTEYKTARYTVQRPVQLGAALGDADPALLDTLAAYGSPLGRAFQFRDDLLGVFGDAETTGKPAGDDLREGKRTVLVAQAYAASSPAARADLDRLLGDPGLDESGVTRARELIADSGAAEVVEQMIDAELERALAALDAPMTAEGRQALTRLAELAVHRVA
ncbi:geranylgeranyl pyrophosphate synthase [Enemella evansiae]|uniref:polyprenyl synthetase family protein n=1 Tax=Enemella evansiae TaxID=2016499 RepID=UPI000B971D28|nr:polyprenyl synthetase family protein [Enemella evansiae]OYN93107.1 geranylgeranyl pyrophosphate synthase [Enemella evansiae]